MRDRMDFAQRYIEDLKRTLANLPLEPLGQVMALLEKVYAERRQVFIAGNGGSAATASHMASDLLWGIAQTGKPGFRVTALADNIASLTAIANDASFGEIFVAGLAARAEAGDVLIAISGSGNSGNLIRCVEQARQMGVTSVGFLGMGGGKLGGMVDIAVVVPASAYEPIEDVHMMFDHLLVAYLRRAINK